MLELAKKLVIIDPVTGKIVSGICNITIFLMTDSTGLIVKDGRAVYRENEMWVYEPAGYAILSRNYPAMAPVIA